MILEIVFGALTFWMMYLAMERFGVPGGIIAFIAGACLFGLAAAYTGQDIDSGCVNYGHAANYC